MYLEIRSGYMNSEDYDEMVRNLKKVDFDTIVVTGVSGTTVGSIVSHMMDKHCLIVRKPNVSTHSHLAAEGRLGQKWIFLDDFVCSGDSLKRCKYVVNRFAEAKKFDTKYVGRYSYNELFFRRAIGQNEDFLLKNHEIEELAAKYGELEFGRASGVNIRGFSQPENGALVVADMADMSAY